MPAVSKNQQRAAAIALKAKKEGTVDQLPKGSASKGMATSMSQKELEKFASTEHKGLPKKVNETTKEMGIVEAWEEACMVREEMLGVEDGEIATAKSKTERLEDKEDKTKDYKDTWTSRVNAVASHSRDPMTTNTRGARVAEEIESEEIVELSEEIKTAVVKMKLMSEGSIKSNRWQELAGLKKSESALLQENVTWFEQYNDDSSELLTEMDSSQLKRYVIRLAKHGWGWEKGFDGEPGIADKLVNDYGVSPSELKELKAVYENEVLDQEKYSTVYNEAQNEASDVSEPEKCIMCGGDIDPETNECVDCGAMNPPEPIRVYPVGSTNKTDEFTLDSNDDLFLDKLMQR